MEGIKCNFVKDLNLKRCNHKKNLICRYNLSIKIQGKIGFRPSFILF